MALRADYYLDVTGELGKAAAAYQEENLKDGKPHAAYLNFSIILPNKDSSEKSAELNPPARDCG